MDGGEEEQDGKDELGETATRKLGQKQCKEGSRTTDEPAIYSLLVLQIGMFVRPASSTESRRGKRLPA